MDFVTGRYDEVTVALIDAKDSPRVQQTIRGPFRQPGVERPTAKSPVRARTRAGLTCDLSIVRASE